MDAVMGHKSPKRAPRHWVPPGKLCPPGAPDEIAPAARAATAASWPCSPAQVPQRCWCARGGHLLAMLLRHVAFGWVPLIFFSWVRRKGWEFPRFIAFFGSVWIDILGGRNWDYWVGITLPNMSYKFMSMALLEVILWFSKRLVTMGNANVKIGCVTRQYAWYSQRLRISSWITSLIFHHFSCWSLRRFASGKILKQTLKAFDIIITLHDIPLYSMRLYSMIFHFIIYIHLYNTSVDFIMFHTCA